MTAVVNNASPVTENPPSSTDNPNASKSSKLMAANNKLDGSRKPNHAGNEGPSQRRTPVPKAWSGMNPITQRSNTPILQNGSATQNKSFQATENRDIASHDKTSHQRLLAVLANAMGSNATVVLGNGDVYSGLFFGASLDGAEPEYILKMSRFQGKDKKAEKNGVRDDQPTYVGVGEDYSMSFKLKDVVDLSFDHVSVGSLERKPNGNVTSFRTDADISGRKAGQERELQPWIAPEDADTDQSLESSHNSNDWDQFQANESLFGVKSDYDEKYYTTQINKAHPNYRQRLAEATRIAQKMGETSKGEANEAEEWNEEEKFSGVRRDVTDYPPLQSNQPNRYQPPARRAPTGKPTIPGAPVDPAIISSQMVRPDAKGSTANDKKTDTDDHSNEKPSLSVSTTKPKDDNTGNVASPKANSKTESKQTATGKSAQPNATSVEVDALKAFKQFSEKQKSRVADDKRQRVMQDKNVKLNDLRGFSKNFKLNTPVPSDLVPILAKDPKKQEEIKEKAQRNAADQAAASAKSAAQAANQPGSKRTSDAKVDASKPGHSAQDRSDQARQTIPPRGPQATLPRDRNIPSLPTNEQGLTQRLSKAHRDRQAGNSGTIPAPISIHTQKTPSRPGTNGPRVTSSQGSSTLRTPTSATSGKFNVKAHEFVPNPAANSFKPTGQSNSSSPRTQPKPRRGSQASSPSEFFGKKKPIPTADRPSIQEHFNPLKRLKEKAEKDGKTKDHALNGGIPFAHATPVTWTSLKDGEEGKSYKDMFDGSQFPTGPSPRPGTTSPLNPNIPHQHQLHHLQPGAQIHQNLHGAPQAMYQGPPHQHLYPGMPPNYEDHRLHSSPGYPGSRVQNGYAYPIPIAQPIQGPLPAGFPYPPHPQMMNPGGPQPSQFRHYPHSPQYIPVAGQPLAAPMMVQQGSQGSYVPHGTPVGVPVYATGNSYGTSQPNNGFPSPGRNAPMMMSQGSFQGQGSQLHGAGSQYGQQQYYSPQPPPQGMGHQVRAYPSPQPQYSQSPQQHYHYAPPNQPHRVPSHGYGHPSQGPPQAPNQSTPHPVGTDGTEAMK